MSKDQNEEIKISVEILDLLNILAEKVNKVSNRASSQLEPVMTKTNSGQQLVDESLKQPLREYPPLFNEYKIAIMSIEESVDSIISCLDSTEI